MISFSQHLTKPEEVFMAAAEARMMRDGAPPVHLQSAAGSGRSSPAGSDDGVRKADVGRVAHAALAHQQQDAQQTPGARLAGVDADDEASGSDGEGVNGPRVGQGRQTHVAEGFDWDAEVLHEPLAHTTRQDGGPLAPPRSGAPTPEQDVDLLRNRRSELHHSAADAHEDNAGKRPPMHPMHAHHAHQHGLSSQHVHAHHHAHQQPGQPQQSTCYSPPPKAVGSGMQQQPPPPAPAPQTAFSHAHTEAHSGPHRFPEASPYGSLYEDVNDRDRRPASLGSRAEHAPPAAHSRGRSVPPGEKSSGQRPPSPPLAREEDDAAQQGAQRSGRKDEGSKTDTDRSKPAGSEEARRGVFTRISAIVTAPIRAVVERVKALFDKIFSRASRSTEGARESAAPAPAESRTSPRRDVAAELRRFAEETDPVAAYKKLPGDVRQQIQKVEQEERNEFLKMCALRAASRLPRQEDAASEAEAATAAATPARGIHKAENLHGVA